MIGYTRTGRSGTWNWCVYDGQERPREGQAAGNTETCEALGEDGLKCTTKRDGKLTGELIGKISADGKTMTARFNGGDRQGKPITTVQVFNKQ